MGRGAGQPGPRLLDGDLADAIAGAADEVIQGRWPHEFPIDVFQTGSGTSSNMNVNEVLSNLANIRLGGASRAPRTPVHPNDHVNMGQSSNDVDSHRAPRRVAKAVRERLIPAMGALGATLLDKAEAWDDAIKVGRTHLQDATPIRMGQVFQGYAAQVAHSCQRLALAYDGLLEVALGRHGRRHGHRPRSAVPRTRNRVPLRAHRACRCARRATTASNWRGAKPSSSSPARSAPRPAL